MATINPSQDYDIIHTLTYASSGGTAPIRLYRGLTIRAGTVYYRAGTSGAWTTLAVSGTSTTFPITSTTMQIAHDWNKSGNDYMTPSFRDGTMTGIAISQKAALSGIMGNGFMYSYADNCSSLTALAVPDTSGLTSVGSDFMSSYAYNCSSLTTLAVPDTSGLTSVGSDFMSSYANNCSSLTTLAVPDTSGLTSVGSDFMDSYAYNCSSLTKLTLPKAGWFKTNNVNWSVPSGRLGLLHGDTTNSIDQADWQALTVSGKTLHTNYIRSNYDVWLNGVSPNYSPSTTLNSPANNVSLTTTTPTLAFTATDPEGDDVTYQVQISTDNTFATTHEDALSAEDSGFSGTDPYDSGASVTYTVQSALTGGVITYYWRVRAKDPSGSNQWGAWTSARTMITEAIPPTVTSGSSSDITQTTATAGGNVTSNGGASITERGIVYGTSANPTTANDKKTASGTTGSFNANLTGLTAGQTYNWRAYAINSKGTSYGSNKTFTTLPASPSITSVHDITDEEAQLDVTVPAGGGASITARGVVYSTSQNPTLSDSVKTEGSGSGTFTSTITGLTGSTTYYARAYATNSQGTVYSTQTSFMTAQTPAPPTVVTGSATNIRATTAEFNGSEVTLDGMSTVIERGIVFSDTNTTPDVDDRKLIAPAAGLGTFNIGITGLEPETTYYVRAYAINSTGTGYGDVETFTTDAPFVPDDGDGYWTWSPDGSNAVIGRSQPTPEHSSVDLYLSDLNLEDQADYTLYYESAETDEGELSMILQWYDGAVKTQQAITADTPYTFTYDVTKTDWAIRLFVTGASVEADPINAVFNKMYLAKESEFSGFVEFIPKGVTEVKLENNWLLDKRRENTIDAIFSQVNGISWHPFDITTEGLGWFEIGDRFTIEDDNEEQISVIVWNSRLTIDGGIKENLFAKTPDLTETDYKKAGRLNGIWRRTKIEVDKNTSEITSLAEAVYNDDGVINTKFSEIEQDLDGVRTTVQSSGGINLIKNSVMYAFNNDGEPDQWEYDQSTEGTLTIQASPESITAGGISGNIFTLSDMTVYQTVPVRKDVAFVAEEDKQYYSFSARVKKNTVGTASITLSNRNETHTIDLPDQTEYYWETVRLEELLPLDDHFTVTITSDSDANLQVTDVMLSPGKNSRQWTQANGEAMNTNVAITDDGMTVRSNLFRNDYTKIDALGFEVHRHEAGGERVFGFNGDETNVRKLKADNQISMAPLRTVPINYGSYQGWAFVRTED